MSDRFEFEIEYDKPSLTSLKRGTMIILCLLCVIEVLNFSELLSILPFVVESYIGSSSDSQISLYTGLLAGAFAITQFFAQFPLGLASDKCGRKPILLLGTLAIGLWNLFLIFNQSYIGAILTRSACGFLVANNAIVRSYITEMLDGVHRTQALTTINTVYIVGFSIGPAMSGILSRPSRVIESTYFENYPYWLPFMILSIVSFIVFIVTLLYLKESYGQPAVTQPLISQQYTLQSENEQPISARISIRILKQNRVFKGACMAGTLMQFTVGLQIELFALWAKANKDNGGLGWSTDEDWIGAVYSSGGLSTLVFATMCLSKIIEAIGDRSMAVFTSGLSIPLVIALGFAQLIPSKAGCFVYVIIMWMLWNAMMSSFLISNSILMNNNIDKRVLGSANGIANGLGAFARAFGPLVAGMIFSWTCSNDVFPINFWLPFLISAIVIVVSNSFVALTTREIN